LIFGFFAPKKENLVKFGTQTPPKIAKIKIPALSVFQELTYASCVKVSLGHHKNPGRRYIFPKIILKKMSKFVNI